MSRWRGRNTNKVSDVVAIPGSGEVDAGTRITLSTTTTGTSIHFTLDGNNQTEASEQYSEPIVINEATTIKAFATNEGLEESDIATFDYTIKEIITEPISIAEARTKSQGTEAPVINHTAIDEWNINEDLVVVAEITDDRDVEYGKIYCRAINGIEYTAVDITLKDGNYSAVS